MSEIPKFSSENIRGWLERETSSIFVPIHGKAEKALTETRKAFENLSDSSKMLLDDSAKEVVKRNMKSYNRAKALNKLARLFLDRLGKIKPPDQVSYENLRKYSQETQQAMVVTEIDLRNWFPRISPFFILDRRKFQVTFERTKEPVRELSNFVSKEYVKTKTLEETFQLITRLQSHEQQLRSLKEQKMRVEGEKAVIEKEIAETKQKMTELKSKGTMNQLAQAETEIEALSSELKQNLKHLQKPFIKLQSLSLHGEGSGLTPEEFAKLGQYLEDPFEAFSIEVNNYLILKQILQKLGNAMSQDKLNLKPEKQRKAELAIGNVLNKNSLMALHQKCAETALRRKQLLSSPELEETKRELTKLQTRVEDLERKTGILESEAHSIDGNRNETAERIRTSKATIEKNVFDFMDRRISLQ